MQVIDFQDGDKPLLVMPYYPAGNLDTCIISEDDCVSAFLQILLGLRHLHSRGIAHRDLKPENLLVERDPIKIIIADFGFAKTVPEHLLLRTFCGTLLYAAPEVYPGVSDGYGSAVDIFSAGVIGLKLVYMLPNIPQGPPEGGNAKVSALQRWNNAWSRRLIQKLDDSDEGGDQVIDILRGMIRVDPGERDTADGCLKRGCANGLFREESDGSIACANDSARTAGKPSDDHVNTLPSQPTDNHDGSKTPTGPILSRGSLAWTQPGTRTTANIIWSESGDGVNDEDQQGLMRTLLAESEASTSLEPPARRQRISASEG